MSHSPLRLRIDADAFVANWRWLARASGRAACGAAIKADGYGIGAVETMRRLATAGCRDFFVATWAEARALAPWPEALSVAVLHGVGVDELGDALALPARPVLSSPAQVARWRQAAPGRACDVMLDTGMNRLGLAVGDITRGLLADLEIDTFMSHLSSADEDVSLNRRQRDLFAGVAGMVRCRRLSLANSAGICLGPDYGFDLTRPGLALYGGVPRPEAAGHIAQVVHAEAQVVQRRRIGAGEGVGYNATFVAERAAELAIVNLGYADGYLRGFSGSGRAFFDGAELPVVGRVSMDLTTLAVDTAPQLKEGDWVAIDLDLPRAAAQSGLSQYELLTTLGRRYQRVWS